MPFTTNLIPNPSFQQGLLGYSEILGGELFLDDSRVLYGKESLRVNCPGLTAGEGCHTIGGVVPATSVCSASLFILGEGSVNVSVVINPGGILHATFPVTLKNLWTRVIINDIPASPGEELHFDVYTTTKQTTVFWISGVQIEPNSPAHDYCDGDQAGCLWLDLPFGRSVQEFEFPVSAIGNIISAGNVVHALDIAQISQAGVLPGKIESHGDLVFAGPQNPLAAFTDFGIFELTDPDPAMTYVGWNNAATASGVTNAYNRIYSVFYPPLDQIASDGTTVWSRAAYMALGFKFASVPHLGTQNITNIQAEVLPLTGSSPAPTTYDLPKQIHTIVHPNRLNYCPNPSIEVATTGWSGTGTGTVSRDTTVSVGNVIEFDDFQFTTGIASLKVAVNAASDGCQITIPNLITGDQYIVSAYIKSGPGLQNVVLACGDGTAACVDIGDPYGTGGGYGDIPYGGVPANAADLDTTVWFRPNFTFTATSSTQTLTIISASGSDVSYPAHFWVDAVLIESGQLLSFYFDGDFGTNYFWEDGGTAGLTRSYYYDQFAVKQKAFSNTLAAHVPLGISYADPLYKIPYTQ